MKLDKNDALLLFGLVLLGFSSVWLFGWPGLVCLVGVVCVAAAIGLEL